MKTYTVRATRSGNWWAIDAPDVPGVHSQARRLDQVEIMAREAIALVLEVDENSFDLVVDPVLPAEAQRVVDALEVSRAAADLAANLAALRAKMVAVVLHDVEGMPFRDIGEVLGLSHQRAHQLVEGMDLDDLAGQISSIESQLGGIQGLLMIREPAEVVTRTAAPTAKAPAKKAAAPRKTPAKKVRQSA